MQTCWRVRIKPKGSNPIKFKVRDIGRMLRDEKRLTGWGGLSGKYE